VLERPDDLAARAAMQWGACLAGLAIENSMLGAAHALANPLTAQFGVTHGEAVALMLPAVVRENARATDADYRHLLAALVDGGKRCPQAGDGPEELALFLEQAVRSAGLASTLTEKGIPCDALDVLADDAARQWTGGFNPIPLATEDFRRLYAQVHA
jgi:alcohol dehydrogenase